jgi:membrane-bound lytic murein transglycosylase A
LRRFLLLTGLILAASGCARVVPPPRTTPPPVPAPAPAPAPTPAPAPAPGLPPPPTSFANALAAGVQAGPPVRLDPAFAARAYAAFRLSCPSVTTRPDVSGLTQPADWREACAGPALTDPAAMARFFERNFESVVVGDGAAFSTGYYEPEIRGCRTRQPGCEVPIYRRPPDLREADPQTGARGRGRIDENGNYVPYYDRAEIENGALAGRGLEIAYAADAADLFFLHVQGSGRIRLPDGGVIRIGYASQNGRQYVAIGRLLRTRGLVAPPVTMQKIREWMAADPARGVALMQENPSYIFFRELTGPGPLGALNIPVTPYATVAADPRFIPLGAPVLLSNMENSRADGLWIAQDIGGAITGPNRVDTFWGAGEEAALIAGGMAARGRAVLLLPRGALARIQSRNAAAQR